MSLHDLVTDPGARMRLHTWAAGVWLVLTVATTVLAVLFPEHPWLMAWVIAMSGYAIVVGHWAAREGAAPSAEEAS